MLNFFFRSALISLCCGLCRFYGEEFSSLTIPRLLNTLSHSPPTDENLSGLCDNNCEEKIPCQARSLSCKVLAESSHLHASAFEKVVTSLLEKLALNPLDPCINCLGSIMERTCKKDSENTTEKPDLLPCITSLSVHDKIISITYEICKLIKSETGSGSELNAICGATSGDADTVKWESIRQATNIVRNIARAFSEKEQSAAVQKYWNDKVKESNEIDQQLQCIPVSILLWETKLPCVNELWLTTTQQ